MKFPTATLAMLLATSLHHAYGQTCIVESFTLEVHDECSYHNVLNEYKKAQFSKILSCPHSVEEDFNLILGLTMNASMNDAKDATKALCKAAWNSTDKIEYANIAREHGQFEKIYYNGGTYWNEEVETNLENMDGTKSNHLRYDARYVRDFYESNAQTAQVKWPDSLTNFDPDTCQINAAYCCWPQDRQARDNNGNCNTPYDENCHDKDPADNTDLCYVDLTRSSENSFGSPGSMIFPLDNSNGEGAIHCHGFAWSNNEDDVISRYKANNLFYVSMYDHMTQRGYVRNIPGAPMCACAEQMPTVSRSDCTQMDIDEKYIFEYNHITNLFTAELNEVQIDFNSCRGKFNKNNDLWYYFLRLQDEGKVTSDQKHALNKYLVGDNNCKMAENYNMGKSGYIQGYKHDEESWTRIAGKDSLKEWPLGRDGFKDYFEKTNKIVRRVCISCALSHQEIYYKRLTPVPDGMDLLHTLLNSWKRENNEFNVDFKLYSSFEDAINDKNPWMFCEFYHHVGFPYNCGPERRVIRQWSRFNVPDGRKDVAFYLQAPMRLTKVDGSLEGHNIGTLRVPGNAYKMDGKMYVTASGSGITSSSDSFYYISEPKSGDVTVKVLLSKHNHVYDWGKAGIMMRQDSTETSAHVFCFLSGNQGAWMGYRSRTGRDSHNKRLTSEYQHQRVWLRLEKRLNTFSCMKSDDGATWETIYDITINTWDSSKFESGLALTSGRQLRASEVIFENFEHEEYYFPSAAPTISKSPSYLPFLDESATSIIHNYASIRYIYALKWRTWKDGVGASTGDRITDIRKWKFVRQESCDGNDDDECYFIKNEYSGRCLYAQPDKVGEDGVGAGPCLYEGNKWYVESVDCGDNICYYIKNVRSHRRLYAKEGMYNESGYGAEMANGDIYKWYIETI